MSDRGKDQLYNAVLLYRGYNVGKCQQTIMVLHNANCEIRTPCIFPSLV